MELFQHCKQYDTQSLKYICSSCRNKTVKINFQIEYLSSGMKYLKLMVKNNSSKVRIRLFSLASTVILENKQMLHFLLVSRLNFRNRALFSY